MQREDFVGMNLDDDLDDEKFNLVVQGYESVKDVLSLDEFVKRFNEIKEENADLSFYNDVDLVNLVVNPIKGEDNEVISEIETSDAPVKIADVEIGNTGFDVVARIMAISNPKVFMSRKGMPGQLCNIQIADDTDEVRAVLWTQNMKHLKHVTEGDIVLINDLECREGFRGGKEFSFVPRSLMRAIGEDNVYYPANIGDYPVYKEEFTDIADLRPDTTSNIIARVIRIPEPHNYASNGKKGKVVSIDLQDKTGKISYTLWNNDVKLLDQLEINEGDVVKILNDEVRERNGELSITHMNGKIAKYEEETDIPEYNEVVTKIAVAKEEELEDVSLCGVISKVMDTIEFDRQDGSKGFVRSVEIRDGPNDADSIRVTLWADDAKMELSKGDIFDIKGGNVELDDYSNGFRVNTGWNSVLKVNPESYDESLNDLRESIDTLANKTIDEISQIDSDNLDVDLTARLISHGDIREFQREEGTGLVRSAEFADNTGKMRISFWDDKAESSFEDGKIYKLENARTRLRDYEVELNVGRSTRFIELSDDEINSNPQISDIPTLDELMSEFYPITKISVAIDEELEDASFMGVITKVFDTIEFDRQDGSKGYVRSIDLTDDTASIRVTLWGDDAKRELFKGDILRINGGNIELDDYGQSGFRLNTNWNTSFAINPDADDEYLNELKEYAAKLGPSPISDVHESEDDGEDMDILARLINLSSLRKFERDDATTGKVLSADFADDTGKVRVSFWDDKAEYPFKIGKAYQIENARTRLGMYEVELNAGKATRFFEVPEEDITNLSSYEELENQFYPTKSLDELDEDDRDFKVIVRILSMQDTRSFERTDGPNGLVRGIEVADESKIMRATLWDDLTKIKNEVGDAIKIQNPNIRFNNEDLELSIGNGTSILTLTDEEAENLPSIEQLKETLYQHKDIENINDEDTNIIVKGTLNDLYANKLLIPRCPFCNNTLEDEDVEEGECTYCGNEVDEPNYLFMIPGRISDDTGDIQITFFNNIAEDLIGMKLDDIIAQYEEEGDTGFLEGKIENLEGRSIEVLVDANFNEYNEETRLSPKQIFYS